MGYDVEAMDGCVVVRGTVPLDEASALLRCYAERPGGWRLDDTLTGVLDACFVAGPPEALLVLREKLLAGAAQRLLAGTGQSA